ncbi:MAG: helicase, partial [Segetibacter sp.]|nr:helicase [Segetibacter sp.]
MSFRGTRNLLMRVGFLLPGNDKKILLSFPGTRNLLIRAGFLLYQCYFCNLFCFLFTCLRIMNTDTSNTIFQKAVAFVNQTNKHLFLTGKAGTGKTTFLKYIKENTFKKMAVVAPTGVAAINAGGVTIHSFFQLPFGPFIPSDKGVWGGYGGEINNRASLLKNLRLQRSKRQVIQELDLLIIDEISMVRSDLLDAVDTVMRHVRKQPLIPFGGVQMVYIGDLFQLPPVAKNEEWEILQEYYKSPFFFDAQVLQYVPPLFIELKKIYRQKDDIFINILNNIRNNCCTSNDLEVLHHHYNPEFSPSKEDNYITLCSHNYKADEINQRELEKLPGKLYTYEAKITGEFYERSYPAEKQLQLKQGAQIMFIKNDKGEIRKFYNGKIGTVTRIEREKIVVTFPNEKDELEIEQEKWENVRY